MKLFLTFPGAKLKLAPTSNELVHLKQWCNAHVFYDNELRTRWNEHRIENLRYKSLNDDEESFLIDKIREQNRRLTFKSNFEVLGNHLSPWSQETVKNEPMLFSCDLNTALSLGGPITKEFIRACPDEFRYSPDAIFDSRVHMLMPTWIPAIPGWHLDDVPRTRPDGQPDHANPAYKAKHVFGLVGDEAKANTEFIIGDITLPDIELYPQRSIYGIWHDMLESFIKNGTLRTEVVPTRRVIKFDWQGFHRGVAAQGNGWRWFGRLTINTHRKPTNEIRQQVQVYMPWPTDGW